VPPTSQDATTAHGDAPSDGNLSETQLRDALDKARKDAAQNRVDAKRLAELEAKEAAAAEAQLSDKERYEKKIAALEAQVASERKAREETNILAEIRSQASALGVDAKLASKLIERGEITLDESGQPTNMATLFEAMLKEYPQLAVAPAANGATAQPSSSNPVPQTGATNPPRGSQVTGASGVFARDEIPRLTDRRLYKNH
jgi:multidrug efflux pump subunit AcrA (membrane-fusion protein)